MRVTVIGAGCAGLVSGACFAKWGRRVRCIDVDAARVEMLNAVRTPIYEPGLDLPAPEIKHAFQAGLKARKGVEY